MFGGEYVYSVVRLKNMIQEMILKASLYNKTISIYTNFIIKSNIIGIMQQSIFVSVMHCPANNNCICRKIKTFNN
jgi:hypothetical protein